MYFSHAPKSEQVSGEIVLYKPTRIYEYGLCDSPTPVKSVIMNRKLVGSTPPFLSSGVTMDKVGQLRFK